MDLSLKPLIYAWNFQWILKSSKKSFEDFEIFCRFCRFLKSAESAIFEICNSQKQWISKSTEATGLKSTETADFKIRKIRGFEIAQRVTPYLVKKISSKQRKAWAYRFVVDSGAYQGKERLDRRHSLTSSPSITEVKWPWSGLVHGWMTIQWKVAIHGKPSAENVGLLMVAPRPQEIATAYLIFSVGSPACLLEMFSYICLVDHRILIWATRFFFWASSPGGLPGLNS